MRTMQNRKGIIALVTLLILAAVGVLGIAMVFTSQLNSAAANNYRHKLQTYYAADGILTLLAQDVLDFNDSCYGVNTLIEAEDMTRVFKYVVEAKSAASNGNLIRMPDGSAGQTGEAILKFNEPTGTYTVKVTYFDENDGQAVYTFFINSVQKDSWTANEATSSGDPVAATIRVRTIANVSIANGDTVKIKGTANSTEWARVDCIEFASAGLGDSTNVESIPVKFALVKLDSDKFSMTSDAYKLAGTTERRNYETRLSQIISRETEGQWHWTGKDSAYVPVTLYDYRSDGTNPEFNVKTGVSWHLPGPPDDLFKAEVANFVQDTLDSDRKPILKVYTGAKKMRDSLLCNSRYGANWYTTDTATRRRKDSSVTWVACSTAWARCNKNYSWLFCDSLYKWFRPSNAPGAEFDPNTGKWSNLKGRPKYRAFAPTGWHDTVADEWVGSQYDSTNKFANIVIYDSILFRQRKTGDTTLFTFGDSANVWTKDRKYFLMACGCSNGIVPWMVWPDTLHPNGTATFGLKDWKFFPLKKRGFKYDSKYWYIKPGYSTFTDSMNFSFTMEIHRKFTYKKNQTFIFRGDDDVWVFINNHKAIDIGGIHLPVADTINLDDSASAWGLEEREEYWFDMFYCERCIESSNIFITTNMMFWIPPQPLKRSWKRDYGPLD